MFWFPSTDADSKHLELPATSILERLFALWLQARRPELAADAYAVAITESNLPNAQRGCYAKAGLSAHTREEHRASLRTPQPAPKPSISLRELWGISPSKPNAPVNPSPSPCAGALPAALSIALHACMRVLLDLLEHAPRRSQRQ